MRRRDDKVVAALWPILGSKAQDVHVVTALSAKKSRAFLLSLPGDGYEREHTMVAKIYKDEGRALREAEVLMRLAQAGVPVPAAVGATPTVLLRRYVDGPVLQDLHWTPALAEELARWLRSCHIALSAAPTGDGLYCSTGLVGDMNLGNFIIDISDASVSKPSWSNCGTLGTVCGIDFGDTRIGDPLEDVGEGFMRILSHRPGYTLDKQECAVAFVREYSRLAGAEEYVWTGVKRHVVDAFRRVAVWRRDPLMDEIAEAIGLMWGTSIS